MCAITINHQQIIRYMFKFYNHIDAYNWILTIDMDLTVMLFIAENSWRRHARPACVSIGACRRHLIRMCLYVVYAACVQPYNGAIQVLLVFDFLRSADMVEVVA